MFSAPSPAVWYYAIRKQNLSHISFPFFSCPRSGMDVDALSKANALSLYPNERVKLQAGEWHREALVSVAPDPE